MFLRLLNCDWLRVPVRKKKSSKQTAESITIDVTLTIEFKKGLHITTQLKGHH